MDLTCLHCGEAPDHKPGLDCVRFICTLCVDKAVRHGGRSLKFPRDEQEEFLLTPNFVASHIEEVAPC